MQNSPVGIFDSGVGGTSIWKEIVQQLPYENTIYIADSANAPYGQKSVDEIREICFKNTSFLVKQGAKLIVVACNTATTNAIEELRNFFSVPFIGIEPAIKPAALATKTGAVGILATKGTLSSALFHKTSAAFASHIKVIEQIGEGLVPLIENHQIESPEMQTLLKRYLQPMLDQNIDYLVLGCTHYPYLIPEIRKIVGQEVKIIDSGFAVAKQTATILEQHGLSAKHKEQVEHQFYTNYKPELLAQFLPDSSQIKIARLLL